MRIAIISDIHSNLEALTETDIKKAFNAPSAVVFQDPSKLESFLSQLSWKNKNLLMMSSGNFGGIDIHALADRIIL